MSLREPEDRRSGRRSRDPSPAYYDDRRSSRYDDRQYDRDDEPRYARAEKTSEVPYAGKKTASFAMPGGFDDDDDERVRSYERKRDSKMEVKRGEKDDGLAYGDKRSSRSYEEKKFAEPTKKYYDDMPPRRESKKYYVEEPKYQREPERERSRERSSKYHYEDERRYEQAPKRESKSYYDERGETETRYAVSKPASKYESSPKPKYATPVYVPSVAAATKGSKYHKDDSDSDSDSSKSDGPTSDRRIDIELDIKHHDHEDVTVRRRPRRKKQYNLEESSSALVTTTTTTSGGRLDSKYEDQGRYGYAAPANSYDRPPGRPVSIDYDGVKYESGRPGYTSARQSETRVTTINGKKSELDVVTAEPPGHRKRPSMGASLGSGLVVGAAVGSLSQAPGSPMLEAYRGTYQSMGSMPSPLMMPSSGFASSDIAILDLNRASSPSGHGRRARFRDLVKDASDLKEALKDNGKGRPPPAEAFIRILPSLTHAEVLELRKRYKDQVKTPDHRGVNVAKHIKVRLKEDKLFLKCCYTTALGQWESEGYWANSYYNSSQTSRDLLIESLMGRSNGDIRKIKDGFKDKKYSDDLLKCMKTELKEDKFKRAVMHVLREEKMEESDRVSGRQVEEDVRTLYRAVRSEKGGETAMIDIVIMRSEKHMREVLSLYERDYRANLAKDLLAKSGNLVGEMLVHILNGIINRAARDAWLLNSALSLPQSSSSTKRPDLLISRLVRYHWDRNHMELVRKEYRVRYGEHLQDAVRRGTRGDWGDFCTELCVKRQGAEVREYERGERIEMR